MNPYSGLALSCLMLAGCAGQPPSDPATHVQNQGYFADAEACSQASVHKESFNVPTAGSMSVIELPLGADPGKFTVCMEHAGRPVSHANPDEYLKVANGCLQEARNMTSSDNGYAECIKRSRLEVEILDNAR